LRDSPSKGEPKLSIQITTKMNKQYYVYILTNKNNEVLYTGVTGDLMRRISEHKEKCIDSFTKRYKVSKLVYYEVCESAETAILREKQIKGGSRKKKIELVKSINTEWRDLFDDS
jgi:putative endonuclease